MSRKQKITIILTIIAVLGSATVIFAVAYGLTSLVYRATGQTPEPFLAHVINTVLGLFLCFVTASTLGRLFASKQRAVQMGVFGPIIEAMKRIAQGDFSVRLDDYYNDFREHDILGELTRNVNSMAQELRQWEATRQEFISNVSHELQSPLTSIRGFATALQNDQLDIAERHHYLAIIEAESTRLSRLTDNLLRLTVLEAKNVAFDPKSYPLDKQIRKVVLASEPQWGAKHIELDVSLEELTVTGDEDLLSQVWNNLIHNAVKFTPTGGKICASLSHQAGVAQFKITDTGVGISQDDQAHIFERFYKADKSRTHTDNGGSGLGLSIVQKIVDMHKGTIVVESKPGSGATFTVTLPLQ